MTNEESKAMWNLEMSNVNDTHFSKSMKKMYKVVDKVINEDIITYEDFTNDMIDEMTNSMVKPDNSNKDRAEMMDEICDTLIAKYEKKYNERESVVGDSKLPDNTAELQDESGVCESESTTETC